MPFQSSGSEHAFQVPRTGAAQNILQGRIPNTILQLEHSAHEDN